MVQLILTSYKSAKKAVLVGNHVHPYACLSINSNNMYIRKIFFLNVWYTIRWVTGFLVCWQKFSTKEDTKSLSFYQSVEQILLFVSPWNKWAFKRLKLPKTRGHLYLYFGKRSQCDIPKEFLGFYVQFMAADKLHAWHCTLQRRLAESKNSLWILVPNELSFAVALHGLQWDAWWVNA